MAFDWREFLELARGLAEQASTGYSEEAAKRTSVSRAYYAAFCFARNYAAANQNFKPKGTADDHRLLREHFKKLDEIWDEVSEVLNDLRKWRNQCDYHDQVDNLQDLVDNSLKSASIIIQKCR